MSSPKCVDGQIKRQHIVRNIHVSVACRSIQVCTTPSSNRSDLRNITDSYVSLPPARVDCLKILECSPDWRVRRYSSTESPCHAPHCVQPSSTILPLIVLRDVSHRQKRLPTERDAGLYVCTDCRSNLRFACSSSKLTTPSRSNDEQYDSHVTLPVLSDRRGTRLTSSSLLDLSVDLGGTYPAPRRDSTPRI